VVAETFLVVWRRWDDVPNDPSHRRGWVYVVARHKAMHVRAELGRTVETRALLAAARHGLGESADAADVVAESDAAARALASLSARDREVLLLVGVEGFGPAAAAEVLGCSVSAMTTRLSRARQRLEEALRVGAQVGGER
jgi:RNA polymerase sigma-70 factor (ECF subfamily)